MMLIDLLDIATVLNNEDQEAVYDIDTGTFEIYQRVSDSEPEHLLESLSFKELAMYATGMHAKD